MIIKISHILFSLLLTISVLAPAIVELFPSEEESLTIIDFEEEDQKENKKESETKNLFFENTLITSNVACKLSTSNLYSSDFKIISFPTDVISPPPEGILLT